MSHDGDIYIFFMRGKRYAFANYKVHPFGNVSMYKQSFLVREIVKKDSTDFLMGMPPGITRKICEMNAQTIFSGLIG